MVNKSHEKLVKLVFLALLTAVVIIFQSTFYLRIGTANISFVLVPIVIGAIMIGPFAGAFLGLMSGVVIMYSGQAADFFSVVPAGTTIIVLLKGLLSGLLAGYIYKFTCKFNKTFASFLSAIVCPVVNTGIYVLGCLTILKPSLSVKFGFDGGNLLSFVILIMVGLNFPFELLLNVVLSPAIIRLSDIGVKYFGKNSKK